jgi:hypothetical protein
LTAAIPINALALGKLDPDRAPRAWLRLQADVGGFDHLRVVKSEPAHIEFTVTERKGATERRGILDVDPIAPHTLTSLVLRPVVAEGRGSADVIDAGTRTRVIDSVVAALSKQYVRLHVAQKMAAAIRVRQKRGDYDALDDGERFANTLAAHLRQVSHDRHLGITFDPCLA